MNWIAGLALFLALSLNGLAPAQQAPTILQQVGFDQRLGAQVPLDLGFRDEVGKDVRLREYFHGKPVVLVLAYYRCPMLCTEVLNGLLDCTKRMSFRMGEDFEVVTVSFDPQEPIGLAAAKKASYVQDYGRQGAAQGWHFLTGAQPEIERLTQAVGFRYYYDAKLGQYAHASGIMVLTPGGRLSRYFYGINYPPRSLTLGLVEASGNKIGSPVHQLLLLCYSYDHLTGRYTVQIMRLLRLLGILTIMVVGGGFLWVWRRELRKRSQVLAAG